jgi:hypothetical protein
MPAEMSDTVAMKRAIKFVQKYMAKAELPLTEADLTHAFFEGKNFGLSRAWHRIEESSPSHEYANEQIVVMFEIARDTYDMKVIRIEDYDTFIGSRTDNTIPLFWAYLRTLFKERLKLPSRQRVNK